MATHERDTTVDTLRGLAIVTMVAANMAPSMLAAPHPLGERVYGTFAAPLFVLLAGMMVSRADRDAAPWRHALARGISLIGIASLIELVGGSFPLVSCDVLYLIGAALPLAYASLRLPPLGRLALAVIVFAVTPWLQAWHYHAEITSVRLAEGLDAFAAHAPVTADNWLVNGYFPLFPWLGFALLGALFGSLRWRGEGVSRTFTGGVGLVCLGVGIPIWLLFPGPLYVRNGYSEMFYPATPGYIVTALGVIATLFFVVDSRPRVAGYRWLQILGQSSLFVYIAHVAIIHFVLESLFVPGDLGMFLVVYVALLAVLLVVCMILARLKPRMRRWPLPLRMIFGA